MSAQALLDRLEVVRRMGDDRWMARCPAHGDKSPSLSLAQEGDRVLIHCFAGCDSDDVLTAVGLAWRDLYPDPWVCARNRPNEGAARYARKTLAALDPLDVERGILRIVAADMRAGKRISAEDRARAELAVERLRAVEVDRHAA